MLDYLLEHYIIHKVVGGFIIGLILGVLVKIILKVLIALGLLYTASLAYLEYKGIISIDWGEIQDMFFSLRGMVPEAYDLIASFGVVAPSFLLGFYLGFREE